MKLHFHDKGFEIILFFIKFKEDPIKVTINASPSDPCGDST